MIQIADVRHHFTSKEPVAKMDTESSTYSQCADYFERREASDENRELERCLWEQVKYMGNGSDDSTALDGVEIDDDDHIEGFLGKLANTGTDVHGDALSMSEWLQFKRSAQGVDRYMETVTAEIQELSKQFHISSSEECKALRSNPAGYGEEGPHAQEERVKLTNTAAGPAVTQRTLHSAQQGVNTRVETITAEIQEVSKQFRISSSEECKALRSIPVGYDEEGPHAQEERVKLSNTAAGPAVTQRILHSAQQGVDARDSPIFVRPPAGENDSKSMETRDATVALSIRSINSVDPAQKHPSSLEDLSGETCTCRSFSTIACHEHVPPFTDRYSPNSLIQESKPEHPVAAEQITLAVDGVCGNRRTITTTATMETNFADRHHFRELEMALEQQLEEMYRGNDCRKSERINTAGVMASVGEAEVAQRIERTTEQALERRLRSREECSQRMMRDRSAMVLQAAWRGRRTRIAVTPTLAARQREAAERIFMFDEECATERVVALEIDCKEMERRHRLEELSMMRCEEQRTRHTWAHLFWLQEMTRQEELARMRAEERSVRALIEIELEEVRRANMIRRAIEETAIMMSEDNACREFLRLEKVVMAECAVMEMEDAASKRLEGMKRQKQAITEVEVSHMRIEDVSSLTWNIVCRSAREVTRRKAQSKSTPIQRAMDPRGVIAARRLVVDKSPCSSHRVTGSGQDPATSTSACADRSDARHLLILERARRRELYRSHLDSILAKAWNIQGRYNSKISTMVHRGVYYNDRQGNNPHLSTVGEGQKQSYVSASAQRISRVGRDGAEYALTANMLSHLGPLQDLVSLELCVEGLTSVSLLQSCTSIKSLSLNVNRLSSTVDLTACKTLELRDNRLSSLEGLAGLPNLRNLRLDINHLTSLHELKALPSLVELSANTNHIRELPEGFASGLMLPLPQQGSCVSHPIKPSTSASELTLAPYALQKLELYHNRITVVHPRALDGLGSLTHLDLGRNQLKSLDGRGMEACPALSTLVLSQNGLREPPSPLRLPLLTELWLSGNQISTMGEWAIGPPEDLTFPCLISRLEGAPWPERGNILPKDSETKKQGERVERLPVRGCADEGFVWLPSLVVLHLEDNALETLGGCWSLAGCPSLRSLDVSFNRLKAPAGVGPCLVACGELEDVRLHDNPASEMCTNTVALNCSKSAPASGLHLDGREAAALPPEDQQAVTNTTSKIQTRLLVECPWCGATSGVPKNENSAVCRSRANDACTNSRKLRGSEYKWVALASMSPHLGEARQSLVKASNGLQEPACGACGLVLPSTNLVLGSDAPDANPGVWWDDVLSASHRWRYDLHADCDVMKRSVDADNEESERTDAFQNACRQGCHEHAQMRHRHRREERDLVPTASVFGEATRPTRIEGGGGAHSASASPSTRKLELEIELGEKHARERRELTIRLLRLHGSGGIGHVSIYNGENEHCVVVDYQSPVTSRAVGATSGSRENKPEIESASNSSLRQSRAALDIQNLWRRCQGRAKTLLESSTRPDLDSDMTEPTNEKAATTLQSAFRGFHVRRVLQAALDSARYIDDELEGLLNANGGAHFKLDRFLSPPPELAEGWMGDGAATQLSNRGNLAEKVMAARTQVVAAPRTVASSTPRQNSTAICQTDGTQEAGHISSYKGVDSARSKKQEAGGVRASTNHVVKTGATGFLEEIIGRELVLAPSRDAEVTVGGIRKGGTVGARLVKKDGVRNMICNGDNGSGQVDVAREAAENDLMKAWGLKDPNVARMMMKRMKRLRKFHNSESRREKMRHPEARYEVFARKAGEHRQANPISAFRPTQGMIESFDSNQTRQLGTPHSGASDVGLGHKSCGVGLQLPPILAAWAGRGRASGANLSAKNPRLNPNTTRHIRRMRRSPDSEQASAARPPSTSSSRAARPWPLPSETFPVAAEGLQERR